MTHPLLRAAFRVHWQSGLSAAMRVWTTLLVALVVAMGLEAAPPVARWSVQWHDMDPWERAFPGAIVSLAAAIAIAAVLRPILRGPASWPVRMLPLTSATRAAIDLSAVAAFSAVPATAALLFAAMSGSGLVVVSMTLMIGSVLAAAVAMLDGVWWRRIHPPRGRRPASALNETAGAAGSRRRDTVPTSGPFFPGSTGRAKILSLPVALLAMVAAATGTIPGVVIAAGLVAVQLMVMPEPAPLQPAAARNHASAPLRSPRPLRAPIALRAELAWIRRMGGRPLLDGALLALLISLASGLAIRNNEVARAWSAIRIAALFAPLAVWAAAVPLVRLWAEARPWRNWEAILPGASGSNGTARALVASPVVLVPLAGCAVLWSHGWASLSAVALWIVSAALLIIPLMARAALQGPAMEAKGLWLAAACALAGALRPDAAIVLALAIAPMLWLGLRHQLRNLDRPLPPLLEAT